MPSSTRRTCGCSFGCSSTGSTTKKTGWPNRGRRCAANLRRNLTVALMVLGEELRCPHGFRRNQRSNHCGPHERGNPQRCGDDGHPARGLGLAGPPGLEPSRSPRRRHTRCLQLQPCSGLRLPERGGCLAIPTARMTHSGAVSATSLARSRSLSLRTTTGEQTIFAQFGQWACTPRLHRTRLACDVAKQARLRSARTRPTFLRRALWGSSVAHDE